MDYKNRQTDRGVVWSPLSDSRRSLSRLCSSQSVKVARGKEREKEIKKVGKGK